MANWSLCAAILTTLGVCVALFLGAEFLDSAWLSRHSDAVDAPFATRADRIPNARDLPFNAAFSDKVNLIWPDAVFQAQARSNGDLLPLWNPLILGGVPVGANPLTQTFYPLNLNFGAIEPLRWLLLNALLHILIGVITFTAWMRALGLKDAPAAFGGIAFGFCGWIAAHLANTPLVCTFVWIPLGLFGVERALAGRRGALLWVSLSIGLQFLAGFPQFAVLGSTAIGIYGFFGFWSRWRRQAVPFALGPRLLAAALCGLFLSGPQLFQILEAQEHCGHQGKTEKERQDELYPRYGLIGLALPRAFGGAGNELGLKLDRPWNEHHLASAFLAPDGPEAPKAIANWSERSLYPGLIVLMLALFGGFAWRTRGVMRLWLILIFGTALALSESLLPLTAHIPGFREGSPARAVLLIALVLPAFAARGLHEILQKGRGWLRAAFAVIGLCLPGAAAAWLQSDRARLSDFVLQISDALSILANKGAAHFARAELLAWVDKDLDGLLLDLRVGAVVLLASALAFAIWHKRPSRLVTALAILTLLDLLGFLIPPHRPVPREGLYEPTPILSWMQEHLGEQRFARMVSLSATDEDARAAELAAEALGAASTFYPPNLGLVHGLNDAHCWREQVPLSALKIWEGVSAKTIDVGFAALPEDQFEARTLDLARVGVLLANAEIPELAAHRIDLGEGALETMALYRNPDAYPEAWFVPKAEFYADLEAALLAYRRADWDPKKTVLLLGEAPPAAGAVVEAEGATEPSAAQFERRGPAGLVVRIDAKEAGYLVLSETFYPGWRARLVPAGQTTGEEVQVLRANVAFRAVQIPRGQWELHMHYEPQSVQKGALASGVAALFMLLVAFLGRGLSNERAAHSSSQRTDSTEPAHVQ